MTRTISTSKKPQLLTNHSSTTPKIISLRYIILILLVLLLTFNLNGFISFHHHKEAYIIPTNHNNKIAFTSYEHHIYRNKNNVSLVVNTSIINTKKVNLRYNDTISVATSKTIHRSYNMDSDNSSCLSWTPNLSHTNLPSWIQSYFQWHHKTRCLDEITPNSTSTTKYLIATCPSKMRACGGISDRLKTLPFYILYANLTKRVLLFHWQKPAPLESFLVPSQLNWIVPKGLQQKELYHLMDNKLHITLDEHLELYRNSSLKILTCKIQFYDGGKTQYDKMVSTPPSFYQIFHDLFRSVFKPISSLQTLIDNTMSTLTLTPGNYAAVHVRARYHMRQKVWGPIFSNNTNLDRQIISWSTNAIRCAYTIYPESPIIYFASDTLEAVKYMIHTNNNSTSYPRIVGQQNLTKEHLHIDTSDYELYKAVDFFPAFVDLYLLGNAKCVSFGRGGFGKFGHWMSFNSSCFIQHPETKNRELRDDEIC